MGKIISRVATAIILAICALFVARCIIMADKSTFSKPIATDELREAYADGDLQLLTAETYRENSVEGYFSAYGFYYEPTSGEVQFAVRWNDSAYEYTGMSPLVDFTFHLGNNTTGETFPAVSVDTDKKFMYNYRKMIADGVVVGENDEIEVVMELRDGYESTQVIKYAEQPFEEYKISGKLKKQILQ